MTIFAYSMLFERKIMAWMQLRPGPDRVGPWGLMQPAADAGKMFFKEDLTPKTADRVIFGLAPFIALFTAIAAFSVIPFSETGRTVWGVGNVDAGILVIFALTSVGVYGISLAGWASGSKFPLLGRRPLDGADDQLRTRDHDVGRRRARSSPEPRRWIGIVHAQERMWYIVPQFVGFVIYLISAVAETNRTPFDLVEAETELVGGFHTEYSGLRFGLFFIAEYLNMIVVACIATLLFLGGWSPVFGLAFVPGLVWFIAKAALFIFMYIWLRTTLPRLRYDRLMALGWKFLLPVATLNLLATAAVVAVTGNLRALPLHDHLGARARVCDDVQLLFQEESDDCVSHD